MDAATLSARRDRVQLLDVREDDEWAAGRIDGSLHIPLADLPARLHELDTTRPVVAVCRSGRRSGQAADLLTRSGLDAHNLDGGLTSWARAGLALTTAQGGPGVVR